MSDMWGICRKIFVPILQTNPMGLVCKSRVSPTPHQFLYKYLVALVCLDRNLFYCDNLNFVEIGDGTLKF